MLSKSQNLGIIIQARLGSTRFPKKILKEIEGKPLIIFLIERLKMLNLPIIVATTLNCIDDELCEILASYQVDYYRGNEENVLSRYVETAEHFQLNEVIRICSDNPLIDMGLLSGLIKKWNSIADLDYFSYSYESKPTILSHFGVFGEIFTTKAIKSLLHDFNDPKYNEHVTYGIYTNPHIYQILLEPIDEEFVELEGIRLTVDTQNDYNNLLKLSSELCLKDATTKDIAGAIKIDKKMLQEMKDIILNNQKS